MPSLNYSMTQSKYLVIPQILVIWILFVIDITIPELPVVSRCPTVTSLSSRVEMVVGMASPGFKFTLLGEQKNNCLT